MEPTAAATTKLSAIPIRPRQAGKLETNMPPPRPQCHAQAYLLIHETPDFPEVLFYISSITARTG
jgi:hypothetical protein